MFADAAVRALPLIVLLAACSDHRIDLSLALASDSCTIVVPAGGSIRYQVSVASGADASADFACSSCLPVSATLADSAAIGSFLRASAPACLGVHPSTTLRVELTAFSSAGCAGAPSAAPLFCSRSAPLELPDGRQDALVSVVLTCDASCAMACKPTTCVALGKNCDAISDGCNGMLACGTCSPPQQCGGRGGSGTPNVCSK